MPPSKHALLGASSAHRWLACTPSARWEQQIGEETVSVAAQEGTLAHAVAEDRLTQLLAGKRPKTSEQLKKHELYRPVMDEHADAYAAYVLEYYTAACEETPDAKLFLEVRVDFSEYVPDGFGTADAILISDGTLHIFDYKYGKGVPVFAENNPQMQLYALGALGMYDYLYDISEVVMHIIQPRIDNNNIGGISVVGLRDWGSNFVKPRAQLADKGEGEHKAGDHCQFCKAKTVCRTLAQHRLDIAKLQFKEPEHQERMPVELSPEEIAHILNNVDELVRWAKAVKEHALEQALYHGVQYPGYKTVEGRSNRRIADEASALITLVNAGFPAAQLMELRSLGELEEIVGKKKLSEVLGELIVKPQGKPTLAKESDKRPAINAAQNVFRPISDEEEI